MQQIKNLIPQTLESLAQPSREQPSNIGVLEKFSDFQTFGDPQLQGMKSAAAKFIDDLLSGRQPYWLTFLGNAGIGKTMLAKRIWQIFKVIKHLEIDWKRSRETRQSGTQGRIVRWRGGFINWGKAVNRMLDGDYAFIEDLRTYDFFVLDDIISEYAKLRELSASKLYDVFESRLGKWTVITANASLEQIGEILDPRIASRMLRNNGVVVDVEAQDFNLRK